MNRFSNLKSNDFKLIYSLATIFLITVGSTSLALGDGLIDRCLEYRGSFEALKCEIKLTNGPAQYINNRVFIAWADQKKDLFRTDFEFESDGAKVRAVVCKTADPMFPFVSYTAKGDDAGHLTVSKREIANYAMWNPFLLGMTPILDDALYAPQKSPGLEEWLKQLSILEEVDEVPAIVRDNYPEYSQPDMRVFSSNRKLNKQTITSTVVVDPIHGPSIVMAVLKVASDDMDFMRSMSAVLSENNGYWLPERLTYQTFDQGKEVDKTQATLVYKAHDFHDSKFAKLAGLGLNESTIISGLDEQGQLFEWKNGQVSRAELYEAALAAPERPMKRSSARWLLLLASTLLSALIFLHLRRR